MRGSKFSENNKVRGNIRLVSEKTINCHGLAVFEQSNVQYSWVKDMESICKNVSALTYEVCYP